MKYQNINNCKAYNLLLYDIFYDIGGLVGTYQPIDNIEIPNPKWRVGFSHAQGILASDGVPNLIKQIQSHEQFEKFLQLAWDDDSELRAMFRKNQIRVILNIAKIEATSVNQIIAMTHLSAYTLEGDHL